MSATRPEHHHPGNKFDPVVPEGDNTFHGHGKDPGLSGVSMMGKTEGQPDKWPQRPDVQVEKSKTSGQVPVPIE